MSPVDELIGDAPAVVAIRHSLERLLARDPDGRRFPPVLIQGETGTGKGLLARAVHRAGPRGGGPFVDVNCAAIPEALLEAELFGFERGAFTDAKQSKPGLFQAANRGTIFLDEVGLLPEALQAKLLNVLEGRAVRRLGSTRSEAVDAWILAATSEDLGAALRARRFREDLYHRLAVVTVVLPPLRERGGDVLLLAEHFLARACADYGLPGKMLDAEARAALLVHRWPGNVRELANLMERAALLAEAPVVTAAMLELPPPWARPAAPAPAPPVPLGEAVGGVERSHLLRALGETGWNITRTAHRLGISRNTLRARIRKHRLSPPPAGARPGSGVLRPAAPPAEGRSQPARGVRPAPTAPGGSPAPARGVRWERRRLAFLRALLPPAAAPAAEADGALALVVEKVRGFGGRVEEVTAGGLVAAFGLEPLDLEDAPRRAAHAALAVLKEWERGAPGARSVPPPRLGLHVCQAAVARLGDRPEVDAGARGTAHGLLDEPLAAASPGAILVSAEAVPFLERRFSLEPVPGAAGALRRLGGHEPTGLGLGGRLAPFVGRHDELALLEQRFREAAAGAVRVVDVVGEPGIGKSRLAHEVRRRLGRERVLFLQGRCTAFGASTPFLPFIEVLRAVFLLEEAEAPDDTTRRLLRGLELLGLPEAGTLPALRLLLGGDAGDDALRGLDGETLGARTREALHAVLRARCRLSPVVLLVDDVHWADTASTEFLLRLAGDAEPIPLLVICTCRSPHRPPWAGRRGVTELRLDPLAPEHCLRLAQHRLGADRLPEPLAARIAAKAEGNPLFAEEIAGYLLASGQVARGEDGLVLREGEAAAAIPATIRELLLARVERLEEGPRALLEAAAVVGRRFAPDLVRAASGAGDEVFRHLRGLEAQELVRLEEADGRDGYSFKHVLIQEAIYESLPAGRREALHERVAEAIERLHRGRLGEWAEVLAHHYTRTRRLDRAVHYLAQAGEKSLRVYSLEEAEARFRQVVALLEALPGGPDEALFADALLGWAQVCYYRNDYRTLVALLERYRPRVAALADRRRLSLFLFWLGFGHFLGARCEVARGLLEEARALGEAAADDACVGYASMGLMYAAWVAPGGAAGDGGDDVRRLGARGLDIARRVGDVYLASQCLLGLALDRLARGRYAEARALGRDLLDLGRTGAPRTTAMGLHVLAWAALYEERYAEAVEHAEEALRVAPDPADRLMARAARGAAAALMGRPQEGMAMLGEVRAEVVAGGYLVLLLGVDVTYGAAMALSGDLAAGVAWIEEAIARFAAWGNTFEPARGHAILGEIYLQLLRREDGAPPRPRPRNLAFVLRVRPLAARRARRHLEEAIRLARAADLPPVLARSLLALGLLCRARGRHADAARHLDEARRVAESLGADALAARARAAADRAPAGGGPVRTAG